MPKVKKLKKKKIDKDILLFDLPIPEF